MGLESDMSDEHGGTWCYGTGHEKKGIWLEEGAGAVAKSTMSEWREIEKIPAKLGRATTTFVRKNGVPGRAFGMYLQAPCQSGATDGPLETTRVIRGPPRASIWDGGDALMVLFSIFLHQQHSQPNLQSACHL